MMDIVERLGRIASSLDEIEREDVLDGVAEITRLRAENERLREASLSAGASLVAAISLLEKGGRKAAWSDKVFEQMLRDYRKSVEDLRAALHHPRQDADKEDG